MEFLTDKRFIRKWLKESELAELRELFETMKREISILEQEKLQLMESLIEKEKLLKTAEASKAEALKIEVNTILETREIPAFHISDVFLYFWIILYKVIYYIV